MRRLLLLISLLTSIAGSAQTVRISGFTPSSTDASAALVYDANGELCATLKLETKEIGWTFEAGLAGIVDIEYGKDVIYVYVPATARKLSVSHPQYSALRDWTIPRTLEPGRTYSMKLEVTKPKPVKVTPVKQFNDTPHRRNVSDKDFTRHFIDSYLGFCIGEWCDKEYFIGARYTFLQNKVGPYIALAFNTAEESGAVFAGAAYRFTDERTSDLDFQVYGGLGLIYGQSLGGELGVRFGWKGDSPVSHWDFGVGCQFMKGCIVPTVEVGLYIWGIPVLCGIGLCLGAL